MAYAKIGYGGTYLVHRGILESSDNNARSLSWSFPINYAGSRRINVKTISASVAESVSEIKKQRGGGDHREVTREKLDRWMKESVTEIVKNLSEAPLLVHLYEEKGTVVVMKAEEWAAVKGRWERGEAEMPEGIIFVEQLGAAEEESCGCGFEGDDGTRAWGLVVQGKGVECGPVCYLLKTTRVGSGSGLSMRCTHFCLAKVSSFRETAESQFRNCWLVGN
ncbi:unnamed protein product [Eruca vesicaria subsp. sativa]|uniref:DUF7804 domain-containing protein n=1 Tax=Eruca vesicaria subsp. sativa TaxID=29727 RepID=A0ABC8LET9_ERUVS|nr:unnamed protein product [Eruca vesicaria subsp. sativa]